MTSPGPQLSVVIVNWNTKDDLATCIRHIPDAARGIGYEVIVVDNCSTDGSRDEVPRDFPWVTFVPLKRNLGFAAGVNCGVRLARGSHVLLLNPDIIPGKHAIATLVEYLETHREIAIVGGMLIGKDGRSHMEEYYVPFPTFWSAVTQYTGFVRISRCVPSVLTRRLFVGSTERQVPGACLLTRREVIEEIGPFDEDFFVWFEDVDWCFRAHRRNKRLGVCDEALFVHQGGRSFRELSEWTRKMLFHRSLLYYFRKHKSPASWVVLGGLLTAEQVFMVLLTGTMGCVLPWERARRRRARARVTYVKFLIRAMRRFRGGVSGQVLVSEGAP